MGRTLIIIVGVVLVLVLVVLAIRRVAGPGNEAVLPPGDTDEQVEDTNGKMVMEIKSEAFKHEGTIPAKYTCDGDNISPAFVFSGVPEGAKSLALIVEDPDVPKSVRPDGMWDHWVVWNMPVDTTGIGEGSVPPGVVGKNTRGDTAYGGPCPPDREHRYFFKLFALDTDLSLGAGAGKAELEEAMEGHILAEAQLMGRYDRVR